MFRVEPGQVELVEGLHDSEAHQLRPEQIHRGARELRIRRQHPAQFFARLRARLRRFVGQNKRGVSGPPERCTRIMLAPFVS